jgi:hypothetical protein
MADEEIQFSGIIGGFDRLKIKFYFVCFVIIAITITFWIAIILLFLLTSGRIVNVIPFSMLLIPLFAMLNKSPETFYKISKNKITVWIESSKFNKTYDKFDIKKILTNNEYTIIYTKDGILGNMYLIKKDFFDNYKKYDEMVTFLNDYYKEIIIPKY